MQIEEALKLKGAWLSAATDIVVIGAGHAGCEAALAIARLGFKASLYTMNLDSIANLPCNPNIGGTAKGQLVREIDALGGEMGRIADQTMLQFRMLNASRGPAVLSPRAQIDRRAYSGTMKNALEKQKNLKLIQGEIIAILYDQEERKVTGVLTRSHAVVPCRAVIVATGTYLNAKVIIGECEYESGPDGLFPAKGLTTSLQEIGLPLVRFKTGSPVRINANTINYSLMDIQPGDETVTSFSYINEDQPLLDPTDQIPCWMSWTTEVTKSAVLDNLDRSPLYSGKIEGVGPRYCPSVEDKFVKFPDKDRHQIFVEPTGRGSKEMYVQGLSSSMPEEIQLQMLHSVPGLENAQIMRTGYAIEYDCVDPTSLHLSLQSHMLDGLYLAGQINGSSGYEEAAAQGLIAGVNAARSLEDKEAIIIDRSKGYIGVLIDDLVTKGTQEPYRLMTSRAEYRLLLRHDNADSRLTPLGYELGLVGEKDWLKFQNKQKLIKSEKQRLATIRVKPNKQVQDVLERLGSTMIKNSASLAELLKRPEISYLELASLDPQRPALPAAVCYAVEVAIKYEGYIRLEADRIAKFQKLEQKKLPSYLDYKQIKGLRIEAMHKLTKIKPDSLGQASRISGVSPADISVILVYLDSLRKKYLKIEKTIVEIAMTPISPVHDLAAYEAAIDVVLSRINYVDKDAALPALLAFTSELLQWNQVVNLTALTSPQEIAELHFLDSWMLLPVMKELLVKIKNKNNLASSPENSGVSDLVLPAGLSLIDVGSGAGFPGLALKLLEPQLSITMIDSLKKRVNFLSHVIAKQSLTQVRALHGRAEDLARNKEHRELYDFASARAVASLSVLSEYCLPFVKENGYFIAMKAKLGEEIAEADFAINLLGGKLEAIKEYSLPGTDIKRSLVIIKKIKRTPAAYPRKAGTPHSKPLSG